MAGAAMAGTLRVAMAQVDCALGDLAENARRASRAIRQAAEQGADLVVFPELSLTGYALGTIGDDVALELGDETIAALAAEAGDVDVVLGFVEQGPVQTYNSAIYLERGVAVHVQRKTYLPTYGRFEEHKHFSPGPSLRAFDTRLGRFALLICNDVWQPPLPFVAIHDGARMLIVPSCSSLSGEAGTDPAEIERDWIDLLRFYARFLQTYVVFVNRVGNEAGLTFWGGSQVVDPWGRVLAQAPRHEPAVVVADVDLGAVRRRRREIPLLKEPRLGLLRQELERLGRMQGDV
jgi:predicted amidohydrolase